MIGMISANASDNPAPPLFSVVLRPHRSLSPQGFLAVMAVLAAMSFTAGTIFWAIGAWPVIGFMGLDVALVYVAFRLNFRAARAAEIINLAHDKLTICRVDALGRASEVVVNPYWARFEVDRHPEFGVLRMAIASHGARFAVGRFIPPPEREKFARAFGAALAAARATPAP
jgi:uncharacterized membrane protein